MDTPVSSNFCFLKEGCDEQGAGSVAVFVLCFTHVTGAACFQAVVQVCGAQRLCLQAATKADSKQIELCIRTIGADFALQLYVNASGATKLLAHIHLYTCLNVSASSQCKILKSPTGNCLHACVCVL